MTARWLPTISHTNCDAPTAANWQSTPSGCLAANKPSANHVRSYSWIRRSWKPFVEPALTVTQAIRTSLSRAPFVNTLRYLPRIAARTSLCELPLEYSCAQRRRRERHPEPKNPMIPHPSHRLMRRSHRCPTWALPQQRRQRKQQT